GRVDGLLRQVQAQVHQRLSDDEQRQHYNVAAEHKRDKSAKQNGDMQDDDPRVGLEHEPGYIRTPILTAADEIHHERPQMAEGERGGAPPQMLFTENMKDIIEPAE